MGYYSVNVDWHEEFKDNFEKWENLGRQIAEDNCTHKTQDKELLEGLKETNMRYSGWCEECDFYEDSCEPMMNYAYPLMYEPSSEAIQKVITRTCLTVMRNTQTNECFLVLCGGGMDLSQQIGLAYLLTDGRIPKDLIGEISTQDCLSVDSLDWCFLEEGIIEELEANKVSLERSINPNVA